VGVEGGHPAFREEAVGPGDQVEGEEGEGGDVGPGAWAGGTLATQFRRLIREGEQIARAPGPAGDLGSGAEAEEIEGELAVTPAHGEGAEGAVDQPLIMDGSESLGQRGQEAHGLDDGEAHGQRLRIGTAAAHRHKPGAVRAREGGPPQQGDNPLDPDGVTTGPVDGGFDGGGRGFYPDLVGDDDCIETAVHGGGGLEERKGPVLPEQAVKPVLPENDLPNQRIHRRAHREGGSLAQAPERPPDGRTS
jgi:hypothetical protein